MKYRKEKYFTALIFTSFVFLLGIFVGSYITSSHIEELETNLQEDFLSTQSFELELDILQQNNESVCDYIELRLSEISKDKVELGRKFDLKDIPESRSDILEKQFVISTINFWFFSEIQEKKCNINRSKVLFFVDNSELSRQQGKVLDFLVFKTNESLTVFTFNLELFDEPLFQILENIYDIKIFPSLIINDEKYEGFVSREYLEEILCSSYDLSIC